MSFGYCNIGFVALTSQEGPAVSAVLLLSIFSRCRQNDRFLDCVFYFTRASSICQGKYSGKFSCTSQLHLHPNPAAWHSCAFSARQRAGLYNETCQSQGLLEIWPICCSRRLHFHTAGRRSLLRGRLPRCSDGAAQIFRENSRAGPRAVPQQGR